MDQHLTLKQLKEKLASYNEVMEKMEAQVFQMMGQKSMLQALVNELENPPKEKKGNK